MTNILILGATGSLARVVSSTASKYDNLSLTLFSRNASSLASDYTDAKIIDGDVLDDKALREAMIGQNIVYVNLSGDLDRMIKNIISMMKDLGISRVIAISSIEIYKTPVASILRPYRALADNIEQSGLDYTILRPSWFTDEDEIDYVLTEKSETEHGGTVSRSSIADFVVKLFLQPSLHIGENLNISKP